MEQKINISKALDEVFDYLFRWIPVTMNSKEVEYIYYSPNGKQPYGISASNFQSLRCIADRHNAHGYLGSVENKAGDLLWGK